MMRLNTIKPQEGSTHSLRRVGRGIGSGLGKTCGRGHKGQKSRAGGFHKIGFEGGQMPLQRRLPKRGFNSVNAKKSCDLRIEKLNQILSEEVDVFILQQSGLIPRNVYSVKVIAGGKLNKPLKLKGISVTSTVRDAILALGGQVNE